MGIPLAPKPREQGFNNLLPAGKYKGALADIRYIDAGTAPYTPGTPIYEHGGIVIVFKIEGLDISKYISLSPTPGAKGTSPREIAQQDLADLYVDTRVSTIETACSPTNVAKIRGTMWNLRLREAPGFAHQVILNGPAS